jgi:hypothetical protein
MRRLLAWSALGAGVLWACFTPPDLPGPYRCDRNNSCGDHPELTCVRGVCCNPAGEPACEQEPGVDGGPDSGAGDAGMDGGADGGTDAGVDAGVDAGCTGPPVPDDCNTGAPGACAAGKLVCDAGWLACAPVVQPILEVCNQADDNCNGMVDERPACGGPANLMGPWGASVGFFAGAQRTAGSLNPLRTTCIKDLAGNVAEPWDGGRWIGLWGGTGVSTGHVLYAEAWDGGTWDLTKPNLALSFAFSGPVNNGASPPFSYLQPQVFLCSELGGRRYEPFGPGTVMTLNGNVMTVNTAILVSNGGSDWVSESHTSFDPARVRRVEIVLEPAGNPSVMPSFNAVYTRWGFGP